MYPGENGNLEKPGERKGIPAGSAPPPVNYSSFQASQIQPGKNTTSGRSKLLIVIIYESIVLLISSKIDLLQVHPLQHLHHFHPQRQ